MAGACSTGMWAVRPLRPEWLPPRPSRGITGPPEAGAAAEEEPRPGGRRAVGARKPTRVLCPARTHPVSASAVPTTRAMCARSIPTSVAPTAEPAREGARIGAARTAHVPRRFATHARVRGRRHPGLPCLGLGITVRHRLLADTHVGRLERDHVYDVVDRADREVLQSAAEVNSLALCMKPIQKI